MPTAAPALIELPYAYCTREDVDALLSLEGVHLRLDDDMNDVLSDTERALLELALITGRGIHYATTRVNYYCETRYSPAVLQTSWMVNDWATTIAARWTA